MSAHSLHGFNAPDLRSAINALTPEIPALALHLPEDPLIVRRALLGKLSLDAVPGCAEGVIDKTERVTIFNALGRGINELMIEGEGRNARFKDTPQPLNGPPRRGDYSHGILRHFSLGAKSFLEDCTWTTPAGQRFDELVRARHAFLREHPPTYLSLDVPFWESALNGSQIVSNFDSFVRFIMRHSPDAIPVKREIMAHDLAPLMFSRAGLNAEGLAENDPYLDGVELLEGSITERPDGRFVFRCADPAVWRKVYPRAPADAQPTTKCGFHQPLSEDSDATPLTNQFYASIKAGHEVYGAFAEELPARMLRP